MNLTGFVSSLDKAAEAARPLSPGDWVNEKGLLMCGKCNAPLEHIIPERALSPIPEHLSEEALEAVRKVRAQLIGSKHRIMCKCAEEERDRFKKMKALEALEERRGDCFGNHRILLKTTFSTDDGRNRYLTSTMRRYVSKFKDMREMGHGIILSGGAESGKTFHCLAVLNNLLTTGYRAVYTSLYCVKTSTSPYITTQTVINTYLDSDIICIDDVGDDCLEGNNHNILASLIASAQTSGIPLLIATRLEGNKLEPLRNLCKKVSVIQTEEKKDA